MSLWIVVGAGQQRGGSSTFVAQCGTARFRSQTPFSWCYAEAPATMKGEAIHETLAVLRRKAESWRRRPIAEKLWFGPAYLLLGASRALLIIMPFRWIAPWLGHGMQTAAVVPLASARQIARAQHLGRAIRTAAGYTPWNSNCFAQAVAARVLLGANRVPYALLLGVNPGAKSGMAAHAWVCTGPTAVTGGHAFGQYAVVGTFVSPRLDRQA